MVLFVRLKMIHEGAMVVDISNPSGVWHCLTLDIFNWLRFFSFPRGTLVISVKAALVSVYHYPLSCLERKRVWWARFSRFLRKGDSHVTIIMASSNAVVFNFRKSHL